jgi:polysaccharide export outer membrane protein
LFLTVAAIAIGVAQFGAKATEGDNPAPQAETAVPGDYRIAPGDRLEIDVYEEPQLSGKFIVDGGGGIVLPLIGSVGLKGLTIAEAQRLIQDRLADGVMVQPAVNLRLIEYRPVFVTGRVRTPGSYILIPGESVKAAIAAAGGKGQPLEQPLSVAVSEFITAQQRVRQLEANHTELLMRKARLEAQRDGQQNFGMSIRVALKNNADFDLIYSAEYDTFSRLGGMYQEQVRTLESQRPRIEAETHAVVEQIAKQNERLSIVNIRLADLEHLFGKGLLRKDVLLNQQIEKSLVEGQVSSLEAQLARLRQNMGELDVKLGDVKATYLRQILSELQDTSRQLRDLETSIGPARRLLEVKAQGASNEVEEPEYIIQVSRTRDGSMVTFEATDETALSPGDVVEVKLKPHSAGNTPSNQTIREALREFAPISPLADGSQPVSR